jgi:hypothetical protein
MDTFRISDLERWQKQGIISKEQLETILRQEASEALPSDRSEEERKSGLNLITVLYYFGGFLALLSFTFIIGINWDSFSGWGRFGIILAGMLIIGGLGIWLRFLQKFQVAGGLLIFIATAILPLLVYTITAVTGLWPEAASFYELRFVFLIPALITLAGSVAVLYYTRFPLICILIAAAAHITLIDIVQIIWGNLSFSTKAQPL